MDDLLIVRRSDRVKHHNRRQRSQQALGLNFGLVFGLGLGYLFSQSQTFSSAPHIGMYAGVALGIVVGLALKLRLAPIAPRRPKSKDLYDGMPFREESEEEEEEDQA